MAWCFLRRDVRHSTVDRSQQLTLRDEKFAVHTEFALTKHRGEQVARNDVSPVRVRGTGVGDDVRWGDARPQLTESRPVGAN